MTGTEIQSYVDERMGITVTSDLVLEAINEGLDEIGDLGLLYVTTDVTVSDISQWYSLEDDYTGIEKVLKIDEEKNYIYQRWEYRNGDIKFFDKGDFTIVARKMPEHLTSISDSFIDLHRLYHNGLKYYALAWMKENDDFEDPAVQILYKKFESKVKRAAQTLISTKSPAKVRVVRHA
jgi:hypothetical protein